VATEFFSELTERRITKTMRDHSSRTITLNNLGARCIESGDYRRSINFLSAAFQLSKQQLRDHSCTERRRDHDKPVYRHSVSTIDTWMTKNEYDSLNDIGTSTGEFVYRNPISIPEEAYPHDLIVPISIIFNLGLANHLFATETMTTKLDAT
jgi:hypothetical protein